MEEEKKLLDQVNKVEDLKKLKIEQKEQLAEEIREYIIQTVSKTGGHLASNLGVVELTLALHSAFCVPNDKIVWDVGHQTYVHKILTGRKEKMSTLRQFEGLSGFPKIEESEMDCFETGHSSTSISAALGMARARDIKQENGYVIAVIGDGALTGGMALEALNDAGSSKTNLIVILNDNEMSISKNVGGISLFLNKLRTRKFYTRSNNCVKRVVQKIPGLGHWVIQGVRKVKYSLKQLLIPNMLFEDIGFRYIGPVDGHDIEKMESILEITKRLDGPILIHVVTQKGKGYKPAEENPDRFHGASSFSIATGEATKPKKKDYSAVFGEKLVQMAKEDPKVVAITAAMKDGTGLNQFAKEFPERFFDIGIAEQHAVTLAAGMARSGLKPVVPIYSSFYQRAYDQIIHDVCMQNLPVVLCADRAGVVGNDGETHQGIYDLAFCSIIPNLQIVAPKDFKELEQMLEYAIKENGPVFIRYPRGGEGGKSFESHRPIQKGKAEIIATGNDLTIIAIGKMVERAMEVKEELENQGKKVEVINVRFLKPLDKQTIQESIQKTKQVVTLEDGITENGLGSKVIEIIATMEESQKITYQTFGYPDRYIKQGNVDQIEKKYHLDTDSIVEYCKKQEVSK